MKLETQVCNQHLADALKQLGVEQSHYTEQWKVDGWPEKEEKREYVLHPKTSASSGPTYSAFTVAELFVMLGEGYLSWQFKTGLGNFKWIATRLAPKEDEHGNSHFTYPGFDRHANTQADALAILLISCIEVKVLTIKDINQRLIQEDEVD